MVYISRQRASNYGYIGQVNTRTWNFYAITSDRTTGREYIGCAGDLNAGANRRMLLMASDSPYTQYQRFATPFTGSYDDAHNVVSLMVRANGTLCAAFDMHNVPLNYGECSGSSLKLVNKFLNPVAPGSTVEVTNTYPAFEQYADGDEVLFFRNGSSGAGDLCMYFRPASSNVWQVRQSVLVSGAGGTYSFYPIGAPIIDPVLQNLHVFGCWRESFSNYTTNHDLVYIYSPLSSKGLEWYFADGTQCTLPLTQANVAGHLAWTIPQNSGLVNAFSAACDDQGRPGVATFYGPAPSQYYMFHLSKPPGDPTGVWSRYQIGTRTGMHSYVDDPVPSTPQWMAVPQLLFGQDGKWYCLFWDVAQGAGLWLASSAGGPNNWTQGNKIDSSDWYDVGPNYDRVRWQYGKKLRVVHQAVSGGSSNVSVKEFVI